MQTEEDAVTGAGASARPCGESGAFPEMMKEMEGRLSPERLALLRRTLKVRGLIGKVSDVAELVHEMREQGA